MVVAGCHAASVGELVNTCVACGLQMRWAPARVASQRIDDDKRSQLHSECGGKWQELVSELDVSRNKRGPWQSST